MAYMNAGEGEKRVTNIFLGLYSSFHMVFFLEAYIIDLIFEEYYCRIHLNHEIKLWFFFLNDIA